MLCRNYNRADRDDGQLSQELSRSLPIIVSGLRETVGWLLEPTFLAISVKVACLGVLKVGDNRGCTGIEPRFQRNEVGPGRGVEQRSNNAP